jgi:hypothetical protein
MQDIREPGFFKIVVAGLFGQEYVADIVRQRFHLNQEVYMVFPLRQSVATQTEPAVTRLAPMALVVPLVTTTVAAVAVAIVANRAAHQLEMKLLKAQLAECEVELDVVQDTVVDFEDDLRTANIQLNSTQAELERCINKIDGVSRIMSSHIVGIPNLSTDNKGNNGDPGVIIGDKGLRIVGEAHNDQYHGG